MYIKNVERFEKMVKSSIGKKMFFYDSVGQIFIFFLACYFLKIFGSNL